MKDKSSWSRWKDIPAREKSLCKGPVVGRNMKTTRRQGCHGVPYQLKIFQTWNISWELVPRGKSSAVWSKSQLSKKVSWRNKSWQGRRTERSPRWAWSSENEPNGEAEFLLWCYTLYSGIPPFTRGLPPCSRAVSPLLCALQVSSGQWRKEQQMVLLSHQTLGLCFPKFPDGFGA